MSLKDLFTALADVFDGPEAIEGHAKQALLSAGYSTKMVFEPTELSQPFKIIMGNTNAHAICEIIRTTPLPWLPPQTSTNPLYVAHSLPKVHVELLGPDGLIKSNSVRLGLYGMLPNFEYGIRTASRRGGLCYVSWLCLLEAWKRTLQSPWSRRTLLSSFHDATRQQNSRGTIFIGLCLAW